MSHLPTCPHTHPICSYLRVSRNAMSACACEPSSALPFVHSSAQGLLCTFEAHPGSHLPWEARSPAPMEGRLTSPSLCPPLSPTRASVAPEGPASGGGVPGSKPVGPWRQSHVRA